MNIPAWQPMSELPEEDDQAIQVKMEHEGREIVSVISFAGEWRNKAGLNIAEDRSNAFFFAATAFRPMNDYLWSCAPDTPETLAAREAETAERYKNSAEYKLARLEDLRRWRPMSEYPPDARNVLIREEGDKWLRGQGYCLNTVWHELTGMRPAEVALGWTYIPGQEPKEEV